jgi:hypothetical protein
MTGELPALRQVLLQSGDVAPEQVSRYLQVASLRAPLDIKKTILLSYRPIVEHLASAFADFALTSFNMEQEPSDNQNSIDRRYGLTRFDHLFPGTATQGPFLYLLERNEGEGLRLIHGLANRAIDHWRMAVETADRDRPGQHPLPISLSIAGQQQSFWGDQHVYYWFRSQSAAPECLISALMALELWMERQVERGRDFAELFESVLHGSRCIATVGACIAVGLSEPGRSKLAVLPLLGVPRIWQTDFLRHQADVNPGLRIDWGSDDPYRVANELNARRANRPQRSTDARSFALEYVQAGGAEWTAFQNIVTSWTPLQLLWVDEQTTNPPWQAWADKELARWKSLADRENYIEIGTTVGPRLTYQLPAGIRETAAREFDEALHHLEPGLLQQWAMRSLQIGRLADGFSLDVALSKALEMQTENIDGNAPSTSSQLPEARDAVAAIAAVLVTIAPERLDALGARRWARESLLTASYPINDEDQTIPSSLGHRVAAAIGIGSFILGGDGDVDLRERMLELSADDDPQVSAAAFSALGRLWRADESLCWTAISLAACLSIERVRQRERRGFDWDRYSREPLLRKERKRRIVSHHLGLMRRGAQVRPPSVPESDAITVHSGYLVRAFQAFPPPESLIPFTAVRSEVLRMLDGFMTWTARVNASDSGPSDQFIRDWNESFFAWVLSLIDRLGYEDTAEHLLRPVRSTWTAAPELTRALVNAFIRQQFGVQSAPSDVAGRVWQDIADWILSDPNLKTTQWRFDRLPGRVGEIIERLVFGTRMFEPKPHDGWDHAQIFKNIYESLVATVGHFSGPYFYLVDFLNKWGWGFAPEPAITWLWQIAESAPEPDELWEDSGNAARTAVYLQRVLDAHEMTLRTSPLSLIRMTAIVDRLVDRKVPLAGHLRERLELLG